uniref:Uncharacterized protein n=1 Tax=Aegilops tauschii subsp. strangulata TaxID=200361 RepID=A0A453CLD1_AEGTS
KIIPERKSNRVPQTLAAAGLPYPCRRRTPSSSPPSRQRPASTPRGRSIETHGRGRHRASPRSASGTLTLEGILAPLADDVFTSMPTPMGIWRSRQRWQCFIFLPTMEVWTSKKYRKIPFEHADWHTC